MGRIAAAIEPSVEEQEILESWVSSGKTEQRMAFRARIILAAATGLENRDIAQQLGTRPATVSKWRTRFARDRIQGLEDAPRPGRATKYDRTDEKRILQTLDEPSPKGYACWDGPLVAKHLKISPDYVWRILRKYGISLARRRSWCISTDPEFAAKAAAIIGLYLNPPENAIVLCVDEKPAIQALERLQGWLRLPNGKAVTGYNHEYKRNGTSTLFAALEVATGQVKIAHRKYRRRRQFLEFMNSIVAEFPDQELHVVLDNLNTHKPKQDRWLSRHPNVHFYFTPTHASWLSQVETWFSILWRKALKGASHTSVRQLRKVIEDFAEAYNETAHPFEWTATEVKSVAPTKKYADLFK